MCSHILCVSVIVWLHIEGNWTCFNLRVTTSAPNSAHVSKCWIFISWSLTLKTLDQNWIVTRCIDKRGCWTSLRNVKKMKQSVILDCSAFINPGFRSCNWRWSTHRHASLRTLSLSLSRFWWTPCWVVEEEMEGWWRTDEEKGEASVKRVCSTKKGFAMVRTRLSTCLCSPLTGFSDSSEHLSNIM